jgi:hypothetical protein
VSGPQIIDALLNRAGKKYNDDGTRTINKKVAIQIHIQDGKGRLTNYFDGVLADSTMQIMQRGGIIYRLLEDDDVTWTNGLWMAPFDDTRAFVRQYKFTEYAGNLLLTVELEGFPGDTMPESQYQALLYLIRYWCALYSIPPTRDWIIRHSSCGEHKYCPGDYLDDKRLFKNLASGGIVVEKDHANGFSVGPGMLAVLKQLDDRAITNEQYFSPNPGQPAGLAQRSQLWTEKGSMLEAFQDLGPDGITPAETWTIQQYRKV